MNQSHELINVVQRLAAGLFDESKKCHLSARTFLFNILSEINIQIHRNKQAPHGRIRQFHSYFLLFTFYFLLFKTTWV